MSEFIGSDSRPLKFKNREDHAGPRILRRLPEGTEERPYTLFKVKPLTPVIGAEIVGVNLSRSVTPELQAELNRALLEWKVIFFRNQKVTGEQLKAFARLWGDLGGTPLSPARQNQGICPLCQGSKASRI